MNILIGFALLALGFVLVTKSEWFLRNVGRVAWAERYLGLEGGSRLFYKILGIIIILLGFTVLFGMWEPLLESTIGRLYK